MELERLVEQYAPSKETKAIIRATKIALLVGISGAGKDTIKKALLARPGFHEIISHTTRPPRRNEGVLEEDDVDYHFVTNDDVRQMLEEQQFVEAKFVHGTVYGTSAGELKKIPEGEVAVTDVDVQGVSEYKAISGDVVAIFVVPPSYDIWLERLKRRYATNEEFMREWPKRRDSAIKELTRALELPYYHCVINDDLGRAVDAAADIANRPDVFTRKDDEARLVARDLLHHISL